jgi:hypothetical protein
MLFSLAFRPYVARFMRAVGRNRPLHAKGAAYLAPAM